MYAIRSYYGKVTDDVEAMRFNTAVSAMMILTNHLHGFDAPPRRSVRHWASMV